MRLIIRMKSLLTLLFCLLLSGVFAQDHKMNYYFNKVTVSNFINYEYDTKVKYIHFINEKDTTYSLVVALQENSKTATLYDFENKFLVNFNANFNYEKVEDLNKLNHVILRNNVFWGRKKRSKKFVEDREYEKDSVTNQTIVHVTQYKNSKRKKIINEHYYIFEKNDKINNNGKNSIKNYLSNKYKINFSEDDNLKKIIHLKGAKNAGETEIVTIDAADFNFTFKIDDAIPYHIPKTTHTIK
ncbi:hypothetical protein [Flavobacterium sp. GT3R68]|uniref:hypothetical protein n=1 Tax=Flavobacterium sp. GT3R68 TaxID=2594437 RepID=UPI000F85C360|nr:hypothetical protein [Flavobacterium sp. GT3R68]RTY86779.1 hypothetical protein EKL32_27140 [Flavobacterium sp. GSN2]TRW89387.1 hypothetical protein FNW07_12825 [Flavobacterium sp. GT3R68]